MSITPSYNRKFPNNYSDSNSVTLHLGDCEKFIDSLPNNSIKLIVTSPPYNVGKEYESIMSFKDYISWQDRIIEKCIIKLNDRGSICWQVGNFIDKRNNSSEIYPLDLYLYDSFKLRGLQLRNRIIWEFGHGLHATNRFSGRYETILWFTKSNDYIFNLDPIRVPQKYPGKKAYKGNKSGSFSGNPLGKNPSDVWDIPNVKSNHVEKTCHPCQFPITLISRLVLSLTDQNDIVFDPFMGVGTTQCASIINNRRTIGCEISEDYYKIAEDRVEKALTGVLKYREDKPIYSPPKGTVLTTNPFIKDEKG